LTDGHIGDTDVCIRTTLNLDDRIVRAAKQQAAREGTTLTSLIDAALRQYLAAQRPSPRPSFRLQLRTRRTAVLAGVDLDDRNAWYDLLEDRH
jgi:hypothetical protein